MPDDDMTNLESPLLTIDNLSLAFDTYQGRAWVLDHVSLFVRPGEVLGLVGETGCGKSVCAKSILRLLPEPPARVLGGKIIFHGEDLLALPLKRLRRIRGRGISMIFQEPMSSLNPVFTVGNQMTEIVRLHQGVKAQAARDVCIDMLARVGLPDPGDALAKYPHELSGGMRQRVMIAMDLSCRPELLLADEPTTALDVTVQGQVLDILADLTAQQNTAVIFITHDMGVVARLCRRVAVMYAGQLVETAPVKALFAAPGHPYTKGLIDSVTALEEDRQELPHIPGAVPNLITPPPGCRFHPRCHLRLEACARTFPQPTHVGTDHIVYCHWFEQQVKTEGAPS
ncbi:MAG: ABC transporter ATP-binding protein [Pseudomonadota bacterium]